VYADKLKQHNARSTTVHYPT